MRGVGRLVRHLIVDQGDAGSIPVHRAKFSVGLSSNGRISGPHPEDASSTLAGPTTGVSSKWQGSLAFNQRMRDRSPLPLPSFEAVTQSAEYLALNQEVVGSLPTRFTKLLASRTTVVQHAVNVPCGGSNPLSPATAL